jgi:hypothetical protein
MHVLAPVKARKEVGGDKDSFLPAVLSVGWYVSRLLVPVEKNVPNLWIVKTGIKKPKC